MLKFVLYLFECVVSSLKFLRMDVRIVWYDFSMSVVTDVKCRLTGIFATVTISAEYFLF